MIVNDILNSPLGQHQFKQNIKRNEKSRELAEESLQEYRNSIGDNRCECERLQDWFNDMKRYLYEKQEPLGYEFQKALNENLSDLYGS